MIDIPIVPFRTALLGDMANGALSQVPDGAPTKVLGPNISGVGVTRDINSVTNIPIQKIANYTAKSGDYILADTTGGSFTLTLPASPAVSDAVHVLGNGWATNNLIIGRNGQTIMGVADDLLCSFGGDLTFVFVGGTWSY